jgi:hypothetical protein
MKERENVGNDSLYFTGSSAHWRTPYLASQPELGILSQRWPGIDHSDRCIAFVTWSHVRGLTEAKKGGGAPSGEFGTASGSGLDVR